VSEHQRDKETPTAKGMCGCEDPLKNLLSYANVKEIIGSRFWWISVLLRNIYIEYLMYPQAQHLKTGSVGSYETARALLGLQARSPSSPSGISLPWCDIQVATKKPSIATQTRREQAMSPFVYGKSGVRFAASTVRLEIRDW